MKSNLHSHYKTDKSLETEGIWIAFPNEAKFKLKRFGGYNSASVQAISAQVAKPYARLIELKSLPPEKEQEIYITTFVKSCLVDWQGVEIDGKETPYDEKTAIELLMELPDLLGELLLHASKKDDYKVELGNS